MSDQYYINKLNLQTLGLKGGPRLFVTDHFAQSEKLIRCKLRIQYEYDNTTVYKIQIGDSSKMLWTEINGTLVEQRIKILQYLVAISYTPAIVLLREHKIDNLLTK